MQETINVKGMGCQGCVNTVKSSVGELNGVSNVEVDLENGKVTIDFDAPVTTETIKDTIEEQGYDVV